MQRIFVNSEKLKPFIRNFGSNNTIDVRRYVYIIYRLLVRYGNMWRLNHAGLTSSQLNNYWRSPISDIALETNFTEDKIKTVLNSISKTPVEFCKAVGNKCFDVEIIYLRILRIIKICDNTVISINGRLAENLIFTNLFYKIVDSNTEQSANLRRIFGGEFEVYVANFAKIITDSGNNDYIIQDEFAYSKNRKAGNNLSPDLMMIYSEKNK